MTAIVGVLCSDGVVVGSDSSTTFTRGPQRTIEQETRKIDIIDDRLIVAGTGPVGFHQRFCNVIRSKADAGTLTTKPDKWVKDITSAALRDFAETKVVPVHPGTQIPPGYLPIDYGALVAFTDGKKFYLCEFALCTLQPEFKGADPSIWYASLGSGQVITDPFLGFIRRVIWHSETPNVAVGTYTVAWTLRHVISLNPGGVGGRMQMAVISSSEPPSILEARMLTRSEIHQHEEAVEAVEQYLGDYSSSGGTEPEGEPSATELPEFGTPE